MLELSFTLAGAMIFVALIIALFPATPAARWLRDALIVKSARFLEDLTPRRIAKWFLIGAALFLLAQVPRELLPFLQPHELLVMVWSFDLTAFIDVTVLVGLAIASGLLRPLKALKRIAAPFWNGAGAVVGLVTCRARARSRRRKPSAPPSRGSSDPEPGFVLSGGLGFALA
jgi:hypothetical protein